MTKSSTAMHEKPKAKAGKLKLIVFPGQRSESATLVTPGSTAPRAKTLQKASPVLTPRENGARGQASDRTAPTVGNELSVEAQVVPTRDDHGTNHTAAQGGEEQPGSEGSSSSSSESSSDDDSDVGNMGNSGPGRSPDSATSDSGDAPTHPLKSKHHRHLRVSCKNIVMSTFTGDKVDGIDAGAGRWWRKFARQVNDAYMYTGSCEWPDKVKVSILGNYLGGMAEDWYDEVRPRLIDMTFQKAGEALVRRFRTKRTDKQIMTEICNVSKKGTETYEQFANRLKRMASLLQYGANAEHNARIVLQTFCERAYPAKQESLEHAVDVEADDPRRELELAIEHLTKLSDSDGAIDTSRKRSGAPLQSRDWTSKRPRVASARLAAGTSGKSNPKQPVIERKQRNGRRATSRPARTSEDRFADFKCSVCKELGRNDRGHNAKYHHRHPELFENEPDEAREEASTESSERSA